MTTNNFKGVFYVGMVGVGLFLVLRDSGPIIHVVGLLLGIFGMSLLGEMSRTSNDAGEPKKPLDNLESDSTDASYDTSKTAIIGSSILVLLLAIGMPVLGTQRFFGYNDQHPWIVAIFVILLSAIGGKLLASLAHRR